MKTKNRRNYYRHKVNIRGYEGPEPKSGTQLAFCLMIGKALAAILEEAGKLFFRSKIKASTSPIRTTTSGKQKPITVNIPPPKVQSVDELRDFSGTSNGHYADFQLVGKLLYCGDKAVIYASPGVGKTVWTIQACLDIASGYPSSLVEDDCSLCKPQHVIYYDGEMDAPDYVKIFGSSAVSPNIQFVREFYFNSPDEWIEDLKVRLKMCNDSAVVVLDNITCIGNTTRADAIRLLFLHSFNELQDMHKVKGYHLTFVVIAHTNKQFDLAGSANLRNFATSVLALEYADESHIKLTVEKNRKYGEMRGKEFLFAQAETDDGSKRFEMGVPLEKAKLTSPTMLSAKEQAKADRRKKYEEVSLLLNDNMSWLDIHIKTGVTKQRFQNWKKEFGGVKEE